MADAITINRARSSGKHGDILDVAEYLGSGIYGSATNALVVMCRQSPLFKATLAELQRASVPGTPGQPDRAEETGS